MKKSLITHQIGENWEFLLRQRDQDNGKNKGKYISLYLKFCHPFKNRLNNFGETPFKYRWRGTERWNLNIYQKSPISLTLFDIGGGGGGMFLTTVPKRLGGGS